MKIIIFTALFIGISSTVCADSSLQNWYKSSDGDYGVKIDTENSSTGTKSALLYSLKEKSFGKGELLQTLKPCPGSSDKLKVSAYIQTENAKRAGLSVDVSSSEGVTSYRHKEDETWGTTSWALFEKVVEIPRNCHSVNIGVYLKGSGRVWVDDFKIEEIGESDSLSKVSQKIEYETPDKIKSPGFEE